MTLEEDPNAPTHFKPGTPISPDLEKLAAEAKAAENKSPISKPLKPPVNLFEQWSKQPYEDIKDLGDAMQSKKNDLEKCPWLKPLADSLMNNIVKAHNPDLKKCDEIPATGFSDADIRRMRLDADKGGVGRITHKEIDEIEFWRNKRLERPNTETLNAAECY